MAVAIGMFAECFGILVISPSFAVRGAYPTDDGRLNVDQVVRLMFAGGAPLLVRQVREPDYEAPTQLPTQFAFSCR